LGGALIVWSREVLFDAAAALAVDTDVVVRVVADPDMLVVTVETCGGLTVSVVVDVKEMILVVIEDIVLVNVEGWTRETVKVEILIDGCWEAVVIVMTDVSWVGEVLLAGGTATAECFDF
jgi:hypothetical protein